MRWIIRLVWLSSLLLAVACRPSLPPQSPLQTSPASTHLFQTASPQGPAETPTLPPTLSPSPTPLPPTAAPSPTPSGEPPVTTLLFTGVIVPARCVQATIDEEGDPDYPYLETREILTKADLTVGVLNATMSDNVEHSGCNWSYQMVGGASNAGAAARAGFDLMSVATNHIKDCGLMKSWCNSAFFDTLDNLQRAGIRTVGAGQNLEEALQPVVFDVNGVRFGFVALGDSKMSEDVFATQNWPGIAFLNLDNLQNALTLARQEADVVIALPHWGPETAAVPNGIQRLQARQLVTAGADLVVGNHTHVVQAVQEIDGAPVFYGLGNFIFDQWYLETRQGVMLLVRFQGKHYLGYELIPTHTDQDGQAHLAPPAEAAEILQRIQENSAKLR